MTIIMAVAIVSRNNNCNKLKPTPQAPREKKGRRNIDRRSTIFRLVSRSYNHYHQITYFTRPRFRKNTDHPFVKLVSEPNSLLLEDLRRTTSNQGSSCFSSCTCPASFLLYWKDFYVDMGSFTATVLELIFVT